MLVENIEKRIWKFIMVEPCAFLSMEKKKNAQSTMWEKELIQKLSPRRWNILLWYQNHELT